MRHATPCILPPMTHILPRPCRSLRVIRRPRGQLGPDISVVIHHGLRVSSRSSRTSPRPWTRLGFGVTARSSVKREPWREQTTTRLFHRFFISVTVRDLGRWLRGDSRGSHSGPRCRPCRTVGMRWTLVDFEVAGLTQASGPSGSSCRVDGHDGSLVAVQCTRLRCRSSGIGRRRLGCVNPH